MLNNTGRREYYLLSLPTKLDSNNNQRFFILRPSAMVCWIWHSTSKSSV